MGATALIKACSGGHLAGVVLGRAHLGQERAQPLGAVAGELSGDKRQRGHSGCPAWGCDRGLWVPPLSPRTPLSLCSPAGPSGHQMFIPGAGGVRGTDVASGDEAQARP